MTKPKEHTKSKQILRKQIKNHPCRTPLGYEAWTPVGLGVPLPNTRQRPTLDTSPKIQISIPKKSSFFRLRSMGIKNVSKQ